MKPLHVVHIIPTLNYGGAERCVVDIVNGGDHHHFRYSIIVLKDAVPMVKEILPGGANVRLVPKRGKVSVGLFFALRAALQNMKPDLVHTHLFGGDVWGRLAARSLGIPVVTTEHNIDADVGRLRLFVKRVLSPLSRAYVACSEAVNVFAMKTYKNKAAGSCVIRYGIDLDRFMSVPLPVFSSTPKLLMIGRLVPQKGIPVALRALSKMTDIPWHLSIVGDGEMHDELRVLVEQLDLNDRVSFAPATSDVPGTLQKHDIILMPSLWEGLGIVAMETMAAARPILASRVGGLPELIQHNKTGFLVPPNDSEALRNALRNILMHPEEAVRVAEAARVYAKQHFARARMVAAYESVYRNIVKR